MSNKAILTPKQVAEIRENGAAWIYEYQLDNLCASHEALRAEVERMANEVHEWEESDKAGRVFTDIIDELQAENTRLKADAEIARLARELVRALTATDEWINDSDGLVK